jgi:hypothetical protein
MDGYRYVVEVIVGGGGGHALYVRDFYFSSNAAFAEKELSDNGTSSTQGSHHEF